MAEKCEYCGKRLKSKRALLEHLKKKHANQFEPIETNKEIRQQMEEANHTQPLSEAVVGCRSSSSVQKQEIDKVFARVAIANLNLSIPEVREEARKIAEKHGVVDYFEKKAKMASEHAQR